nr:RICIN domain-containing protein [Streptomyces atratus]
MWFGYAAGVDGRVGRDAACVGQVRDGGRCCHGDGTQVQLSARTGAASQKWASQTNGSLVATASGKCLDATGHSSANDTRLQIWTCAAGADQLWTLLV